MRCTGKLVLSWPLSPCPWKSSQRKERFQTTRRFQPRRGGWRIPKEVLWEFAERRSKPTHSEKRKQKQEEKDAETISLGNWLDERGMGWQRGKLATIRLHFGHLHFLTTFVFRSPQCFSTWSKKTNMKTWKCCSKNGHYWLTWEVQMAVVPCSGHMSMGATRSFSYWKKKEFRKVELTPRVELHLILQS